MAIKARLRSIEKRIPECECRTRKIEYVVVHPGELEPEAPLCPKCGRVGLVIVVKYGERGMREALRRR